MLSNLWCWNRFLKVPWQQGDKSIRKEINPEYSLEGLMLKLQYFGRLMQRANSLEKTLMLGKIESKRRRGQQRNDWMASPTQWIWVWVNSGSWRWTTRPDILQSMGSQRVGHDWTELNWTEMFINRWMDKEDVVYIFNGILLSHKKWNFAICSNIDGLEGHYSKGNK